MPNLGLEGYLTPFDDLCILELNCIYPLPLSRRHEGGRDMGWVPKLNLSLISILQQFNV